jgi:hypothetical protein
MQVVFHLSKFYDWVPVPANVTVTPEDIADGKVMPNRDGSGYRARVVKSPPGGTHNFTAISEEHIVQRSIGERTDVRLSGRLLTRKEVVARILQDQVIGDKFEWKWITKIEVHDDGPDEKLVRAHLAVHVKADHGRRLGQKNIDPATVEDHVAAYLEPADHAAHLSQHFCVKAVP